jgi:O-antigen ligase
MLFLLIAIPLLGAIMLLLLLGRLMEAGALLLVVLYVNFSDIGIRYHGWPSVAEPLVLLFAVTLFVRRTRAGGSRSLAACAGFWSAAAIYLAVVLASTVWATNGGAAAHQASNVAKGLLIVYVIAELFDAPEGQRLAIWALIGAGAALAAISVIQAITHTYGNLYLGLARAPVRQIVGTTIGHRSAGPIGDPDYYGLMLAAVVPLAVLRVWDERRPALRAAAVVSAFVLLVGVGLTYSRGAVIALAAATVALLVAIRVPVRTLLVGGAVLVALAAIAPSHYLQRFSSLGRVDHSFQGRVDSQYIALVMFADHPLLGVGADNYQFNYIPYVRQLHLPDAASTVHDLYLVAASETGLIGLLAFAGALFSVLLRIWRRRASAMRVGDRLGAGLALGSFLALFVYLIGALFLPLAYPRYLWILVGLALSISLPSRQVVRA